MYIFLNYIIYIYYVYVIFLLITPLFSNNIRALEESRRSFKIQNQVDKPSWGM